MIGRGMAEGIDRSQDVVNRSLGQLADGLTLDGYTFGMPTPVMSLPANACQMVNGTQSNQQGMQSQLDELLAEVQAFHEDMPFILQQLGINIDGREFGRAVRRYATA